MKRIFFFFFLAIKWVVFAIGVFALLGYLFNVVKATMTGGWEGFTSIHHHNAYVTGRAPSFFDFIFYPLLIAIIFLISYLLHLLAKKLRQ